MIYQIQSFGLSEYEQGLLNEQLKVVDKRFASNWSYKGEGQEGDVIFSKRRLKVRSGQVLVLLVEPKEQFPKQVVNHDHEILLELPMRILGVMDVLRLAEKQLSGEVSVVKQAKPAQKHSDLNGEKSRSLRDSSGTLFSNQLSALANRKEKAGLLRVLNTGNGSLWFQPATQEVHTNLTESTLVSMLVELGIKGKRLSIESQQPPSDFAEYQHYSLSQLLWALCLAEVPSHSDTVYWQNQRVCLNRWPLFGVWKTDSRLMRLVALYTRDSLSIDDGVLAEKCSKESIVRLFRACQMAGLGLEIRPVSQNEKPKVIDNSGSSQGRFMNMFRKTLGLSY